jgi:uncharacterized Zn-binding protein involved in type VI secretion
MKKPQIILAGVVLVFGFNFILHAQEKAMPVQGGTASTVDWNTASDLQVMLEAVEQTTPVSAEAITNDPAVTGFAYWSAQHAPGSSEPWPPLPDPNMGVSSRDFSLWPLGDNQYLVNDLGYNYNAPRRHRATSQTTLSSGGMQTMIPSSLNSDAASAMDIPSLPGGGDTNDDEDTNDYGGGLSGCVPFSTNGLWLQITNMANGLVYLNLNNATDFVYAAIDKPSLSVTGNWSIAAEIFPTNSSVMPFTVPASSPTNLFIWAYDWTGVMSGTNQTPEWWFWEYYGTTNLSDTNLDSFGYTLLYDYENRFNPSAVLFSLQFPGDQLQTNTVNGSVSIFGGTPFYEAVLVNDTNKADAVWQPYTGTNLTVTLGATNGIYTVSVGLRGLTANATPTWQGAQLIFSQPVAPAFVITSPASTTVSTPLIQLQGLANESLSSLTFDVSNAVGVVTNQQGYWNPSFFDANESQFTTNYFQCYDVPLTNGLNTITLHATDLSGNVTTTNFNFTLDYSGDTNPPVLTILWPTSGTVISGSNFTMQAQMDDDTATVSAQIVDTNGDTNVVQGLVERSGAVWFNGLPLAAGTNDLTVTATDVAGNMSVTNLSVVQSTVNVTIDPISGEWQNQPNQTSVTVTGTIDNPDDTVTVNGVPAGWYDGEGGWEADNVPVNPTGMAGLNAQVSDPGNNPLGGQNVYQPQPALITLMSYVKHNYSYETMYNYCRQGSVNPNEGEETINWLYQSGGADAGSYYGVNGDCAPDNGSYANGLGGGYKGISPTWEINNATSTFYFHASPQSWLLPDEYDIGNGNSDAHAKVMIVPSGQQSIGQTALYLVQAQVINEDSGLQLAAAAVRFMNQLAETATEDVTNDDGSVWSQALICSPAGVPVEVTPKTPGNINFSQMKLSPAIIVYFSVDPNGLPANEFNASSVQTLLQSELSANVFDSPPAGHSVQIQINVEATPKGKQGWNGNPKTSYFNRVDWSTLSGIPSDRGSQAQGIILISDEKIDEYAAEYTKNVSPQTWVNIFAHEGVWGNAGNNYDCFPIPFIRPTCTDGDISGGSIFSSAFLFAPYIVTPYSRTALRNEFGF